MELTEDEQQIVNRVANYLAPRMVFGYHTIDDMRQECAILALEAIKKYSPDKGASLHTFVHLYVKRRLLNLKRDTFKRPIPKNASESKREKMERLNSVKQAALSPACSKTNVLLVLAPEESTEHEFINYVKQNIDMEYLSDLNAMLEGVNIPKHRKKAVISEVKKLYERWTETEK